MTMRMRGVRVAVAVGVAIGMGMLGLCQGSDAKSGVQDLEDAAGSAPTQTPKVLSPVPVGEPSRDYGTYEGTFSSLRGCESRLREKFSKFDNLPGGVEVRSLCEAWLDDGDHFGRFRRPVRLRWDLTIVLRLHGLRQTYQTARVPVPDCDSKTVESALSPFNRLLRERRRDLTWTKECETLIHQDGKRHCEAFGSFALKEKPPR